MKFFMYMFLRYHMLGFFLHHSYLVMIGNDKWSGDGKIILPVLRRKRGHFKQYVAGYCCSKVAVGV